MRKRQGFREKRKRQEFCGKADIKNQTTILRVKMI